MELRLSSEQMHEYVRGLHKDTPRYPFRCIDVDDHQGAIVVFGATEDEAEKRAQQILALPDLIATCESAAKELAFFGADSGDVARGARSIAQKCRSIVTKAKGGAS